MGYYDQLLHNREENRRAPDYSFSYKPYGVVYYNNIVMETKGDILELSMLMGTATEKNKSQHRIAIALKGIDNQEVTETELVNIIQSKNPGLSDLSKEDLIAAIFEDHGFQPLEGKTIFQKSTTERKFFILPNKIDPSVEIAVRCTCFTGDTKVILGDGSTHTLKELEGRENFSIVGYNFETKTFEKTNAIKCEKKQDSAKVIEVTLDNGKIIKTTPDHRFLLKSEEWIKAKDLKEGVSLKALYYDKENNEILQEVGKSKKLRKHADKSDYYVYIYLDPRKPGNYIYGDYSFSHEPFYVGKGRGYRAYKFSKKDRNSYCTNKINKMKKEELEPIIIKQSYGLTETASLQLEEKIIKTVGLLKDNLGPLVNFTYGGEGYSGLECSEEQKEKMRNSNPMFNKEVVEKVNKIFIGIIKKYGEFKEECYINDYRKNEWSLDYIKKHGFYNEMVEYSTKKSFINHKVVSIKEIENEDVYCITSEFLGNFLIECSDNNSEIVSGVVVENCSDFIYSWAWYNANSRCLIGVRPPSYQKKSTYEKGNFRVSRNPQKIPGMCKHLLLFLALLMKGGLIQKLPTLTGPLSRGTSKIYFIERRDIHNLLQILKADLVALNQGRGGFNQ